MPVWIFLRGLTREGRHWGGFTDQFQRTFPDCQIVALDLPGNGRFNMHSSPCHVKDLMAHCRIQMASLGIPPPFNLLAMSLGAMVSVAWSAAYPHEVSRSVLINTSLRPFSPFYHRLRPDSYAALLRLVLIGGTAEEWESTVLHLTSNRHDHQVLPDWMAIRRRNPVSTLNALRQLVAAARYSAPAIRPRAATLILASEQDRLVSVDCSKALAQSWDCALRVHPDAGHDLPLDEGLWVASQVKQWMAG